MTTTEIHPPTTDTLTTYVAGPMTGFVEHNYPAFRAAANALRVAGHDVLSPAEHTETADSWEGWMRLGIAQLIRCDTIALLPGWRESRGARIEHRLARTLGMRVIELPDDPRLRGVRLTEVAR